MAVVLVYQTNPVGMIEPFSYVDISFCSNKFACVLPREWKRSLENSPKKIRALIGLKFCLYGLPLKTFKISCVCYIKILFAPLERSSQTDIDIYVVEKVNELSGPNLKKWCFYKNDILRSKGPIEAPIISDLISYQESFGVHNPEIYKFHPLFPMFYHFFLFLLPLSNLLLVLFFSSNL